MSVLPFGDRKRNSVRPVADRKLETDDAVYGGRTL